MQYICIHILYRGAHTKNGDFMDVLYILLFALVILLQIVIILGSLGRKKPVILMREGVFATENMKKRRVSAADIMAAARKKGYFNIADIDTAVLESDGSISILPAAQKRRLEPKDFNFSPVREGMGYPVYQNGVFLFDNLKSVGFTEQKLAEFLRERGYELRDTELIVINENGRVSVF